MTLLSLLLACAGGADDTGSAADDACGDIDGAGTDTGNVPNVLGNWTSTFGQNFYDDDCSATSLSASSETWIGSFTVDGRAPDALYLEFGDDGERFWGAMDSQGGITFAGAHAHEAGTLHVQFGGLVYEDATLGRDIVDGAAFLGLDADGDGTIDCRAKGSWKAIKSGL